MRLKKVVLYVEVAAVMLSIGFVIGCSALRQSPVDTSSSQDVATAEAAEDTSTALPPAMDINLSGDTDVPAFSGLATPTAHWYSKYPQQQYDENMTTAENFCESHQARPLSIDHDVIMAVRYGLELMVADGYRTSLVRAKGARLIKYYYWAKFKYDEHTEVELKRLAKLTKCKYRRPRYWDE